MPSLEIGVALLFVGGGDTDPCNQDGCALYCILQCFFFKKIAFFLVSIKNLLQGTFQRVEWQLLWKTLNTAGHSVTFSVPSKKIAHQILPVPSVSIHSFFLSPICPVFPPSGPQEGPPPFKMLGLARNTKV